MNTITDQHCIERTLQGETQAFGTLVERYQDFVFTIVYRMVKVREEAEEVAQDSFVKAFESLSSFRGEAKFSSWLYSIAYRKPWIRFVRTKSIELQSSLRILLKEIQYLMRMRFKVWKVQNVLRQFKIVF